MFDPLSKEVALECFNAQIRKYQAEIGIELFGFGKPKPVQLTPEQKEVAQLRDELQSAWSYINSLGSGDYFHFDNDSDFWDDDPPGTTGVTPAFCNKILTAAKSIDKKSKMITNDLHSVAAFRRAISTELSFLLSILDLAEKQKPVHITTYDFEEYADKLLPPAENLVYGVSKKLSHFHLPSSK